MSLRNFVDTLYIYLDCPGDQFYLWDSIDIYENYDSNCLIIDLHAGSITTERGLADGGRIIAIKKSTGKVFSVLVAERTVQLVEIQSS